MGVGIAAFSHLSEDRIGAGWAKRDWGGVLIGGVCFAIFMGVSSSLAAQVDEMQPTGSATIVQQANVRQGGGEQATEVAAKEDVLDLPDAPAPTAAAGAAYVRGVSQTASSSLQPPAQNPPDGGLSLGDLGLTPAQTEGSAARQALLDRRTQMLKIHQRLGLITVIPVAAACISSIGAPPKHGNFSNVTDRDVHVGLGAAAVVMYGLTASYAIRAPKVSNEPARGGVKWHKYLIYIHAPGMILTPILGAIAFNQVNSGQKVHGIAAAHGAVATATAISYGAAIVAVSWPIHLRF